VLAGILVIGAWAAITGKQVLDHAFSLRSHLASLEQLAQGGTDELDLIDLEPVGQHLAGMRHDLEVIQSQVGPLLPAARLLRWVPRYGGDLVAAPDLLDIAVGVASASDRTFQSLSPALDLLSGSPGKPSPAMALGQRLLPLLVEAQPELRVAQQNLVTVEQVRSRIEAGSLSPQVAGLLERLDRYLPWFQTAVDGALLAPDLLGADGPRTYLILAQNNHELRPTGGFISGVGQVRAEGGDLVSKGFMDSYAVDNLEVPHELTPPDFRQTLHGELWFFRDTNWDADFPTSARRALDVYARDQGIRADGVIALDLTALELLLEGLGPIHIDGIAAPVTSANVQQSLQEQWANPSTGPRFEEGRDPEWWQHRKDFAAEIASAVVQRLTTGQGLEPQQLLLALKTALDEKHLLIYLTGSQAAGLLRERNWDGALDNTASPCDALLVVDTNVGFNKVDPNVQRSIDYQVDLADQDAPHARLTLTYHNRSSRPVEFCVQEACYGDDYADMMDRCYWNYVRVYVPAGSVLLTSPDLPLPAGSLWAREGDASLQGDVSAAPAVGDWTVLTAFFDLPPGAERTLTFEYRLPQSVLERTSEQVGYCLHVRKQPGTIAVPFCLEVFPLADAELVEWAPSDLPLSECVCTDLRTDREFAVGYAIGKGP
jgi:hypothetical protein